MEKRAPEVATDRPTACRVSPFWQGAILIGIALIFWLWLGWRRWADPVVDFGLQLYAPWRLSQGAVLYQDVMYIQGPLSVIYHSLLFKFFGVSMNVILASNFLILVLLLTLVYRSFARYADILTATMIGLGITVMACGQFLIQGNYNYLSPYSHEILHGITLIIVQITCLTRWLENGRRSSLLIAGLCLGMLWMTKPEIFLTASVTTAIGLGFKWQQSSMLETAKATGQLLLTALIPLAGVFSFSCLGTSSAQAGKILLGAWLPLLHARALDFPFYRVCTGLDAPWLHILQSLSEFAGLLAILLICAWRLPRPQLEAWVRLFWVAVAGAISILYKWQAAGHSLPIWLILAAILLVRGWKLTPVLERRRWAFPVLWLGFSLTLLAKLGFNPRLVHYGVFLAMPAAVAVIYLLLYLIPRRLEAWDRSPDVYRNTMLVFLATGLIHLTIHSSLFYLDKNSPLGTGGDTLITYNPKVNPTGKAMDLAANWIDNNTSKTNTLAVLPEGALLNYLTRRVNPTPYAVFAYEVSVFGDANMLAAYQQHPPDYITLIHSDSREFGHTYFGKDKGFGYDLIQWVQQNYDPVYLIGEEPLQTNGFGIKILKRRS